MSKSRKDYIEGILSDNKAGLHVNDIAEELVKRGMEENVSVEDLASSVSSSLSQDVRKKGKARFKKISNGKGGYKKGWYQVKKKRASSKAKAIKGIVKGIKVDIPAISTLYSGKAGEFAVLSELLFNEFNASMMSVDDGIDIVASKDGDFFYIQVKTASNKNTNFHTFVKRKVFDKYNNKNTFYVIVLRYLLRNKVKNDFVILNSTDIERFIETEKVRDGKTLQLNIKLTEQGKATLNDREDITYFFNNFDYIK